MQLAMLQKIANLEAMLNAKNPMIRKLCEEIHKACHKDPELVYFLTPEQVGVIVRGLVEVTQAVTTADLAKKIMKTSNAKASNNLMDF